MAYHMPAVFDAQEKRQQNCGDKRQTTNDKRIVERGTHAQVLEQQGAYERMWALQQSSVEEQG